MTRTRLQIVLASLCAVALIIIPLSGSAVWAQSSSQQYPTDQSQQKNIDRNQDLNTNQNLNSQSSGLNREKSSSAESGTLSNSQKSETQTPASKSQVDRNKNNEVNSASSLPRTAGELPVLAFIGFLSLIAAAGTRLVARTNR